MNLFEVVASCAILLVFSYSLVPCMMQRISFSSRLSERRNTLVEKTFLYDSFILACAGGTEKVEEWKSSAAVPFGEVSVETVKENTKAVLYRVSFTEMGFSFYGAAEK